MFLFFLIHSIATGGNRVKMKTPYDDFAPPEGGRVGGGSIRAEDCNLEIYSRREYVHHAVEAWEIIKPNINIDAGGKFGGLGRGFYFSAHSYVTQALERPICKPSTCNICEKSHLNEAKRYF